MVHLPVQSTKQDGSQKIWREVERSGGNSKRSGGKPKDIKRWKMAGNRKSPH